MAIPWLPREIGARFQMEHEESNMRASYLLSTAYAGGCLSRDDGKRPSWFNRTRLAPVTAITTDLQEHLNSVCHVVCTKVRQDATSEPAAGVTAISGAKRPPTTWQAALLSARVIWRAVFASAAGKSGVNQKAVPLLFMCACDSLMQACRKLLTEIWNEAQLQFTSRINKYRNIKSRPPWSVLEGMEFKVFCEMFGFGLEDPSNSKSTAFTKPASNLQDYFETVLALRFAIDWLAASMGDAQEFLEQATKRTLKRMQPKPRIAATAEARTIQALKEKTVDSFAMMWADDAELRGVASLTMKLMEGLEGPTAALFSATFCGQLLLAVWKGTQPMLEHLAKMGISRISEAHAAVGRLPAPPLEEIDQDNSQSLSFDRVAASYAPPSQDTVDMMAALPRGVVDAVIKVQSVYRGYVFRARYFPRCRVVAAYGKAVDWPRLTAARADDFDDSPKEKERKKRKKKGAKTDPAHLEKEIAEFKPNVSKYHGGETSQQAAEATMSLTMRSVAMPTSVELHQERRAWPLPTADHRACADLFALYMYNMLRRKELTRMWQTLCGSYERAMDTFNELITKNPALKPMLESIAAQLKRGSVVGYDKAFIAKQQKGDAPTKQRGADAEMFRTKKTGAGVKASPEPGGLEQTADSSMSKQMKVSGGQDFATMLPPMQIPSAGGAKNDSIEITGEYLQNYLKEMDGDDSQFKDITSSVVALSTGTSPPRTPPHEFLLKAEQASAGPDQPAPKRPRLDVPFCLQRVKPIWLPIKAHRFAAYRAKVLQLLPQRILQQYIDFEKQGQYAACIKLLESATPGSLNVLSPATLVQNKPLLVETVLQLIVGYSGLCLKNQQGAVAVKLITQVLDNMSLALRDLHPGHRTVLEAYLYDTALSVCYYMPMDISLTDRSESFFQQASERYLRLNHVNRYCKCCLRAAAVLHGQGNRSEAEYYTQQALNKLADQPVSSLLAVCYHNLAVHTVVQHRLPDAVAHVRSYVALLRQLPKLGNAWMQMMDNTQWLILKTQELWPQYQQQAGIRDSQIPEGVKPAWASH